MEKLTMRQSIWKACLFASRAYLSTIIIEARSIDGLPGLSRGKVVAFREGADEYGADGSKDAWHAVQVVDAASVMETDGSLKERLNLGVANDRQDSSGNADGQRFGWRQHSQVG